MDRLLLIMGMTPIIPQSVSAMVIGPIPITVINLITLTVTGPIIILEEAITGAAPTVGLIGIVTTTTATIRKTDREMAFGEAIIGVATRVPEGAETLQDEVAVRAEGWGVISIRFQKIRSCKFGAHVFKALCV